MSDTTDYLTKMRDDADWLFKHGDADAIKHHLSQQSLAIIAAMVEVCIETKNAMYGEGEQVDVEVALEKLQTTIQKESTT